MNARKLVSGAALVPVGFGVAEPELLVPISASVLVLPLASRYVDTIE